MKISWEGVGNFYRESGDLPGATKTKTFAGKVVFTVLSDARHLPRLGAGFFIFVIVMLPPYGYCVDLSGNLKSGDTPVPYAQLFFISKESQQHAHTAFSDSTGWFFVKNITTGTWIVRINAFGYSLTEKEISITPQMEPISLKIDPAPLLIDELVVRESMYVEEREWSESILLDTTTSNNLATTLDAATGVNVRRYGGLGSFSTVSIRGSTSEQVQIFIDGVPLSSAVGGGIDLSRVSLTGIETIDIYRGAIPAQLGGHSMGGVVHLKTRRLHDTISSSLNASQGSFKTRQFTTSLGFPWRGGRSLFMTEYRSSGNKFRYWDDNGTPFNLSDDEWTKRINSDFKSFYALAKTHWLFGAKDINVHSTFFLSRKGIPGIGANPSRYARFNTWRHITEARLTGRWGNAHNIYRLKVHSIIEESTFKDSLGEVGIDIQDMHNRTQSFGITGESTLDLPLNAKMNIFTSPKTTFFIPNDRLRKSRTLPKSTRLALTIGSEIKIPLLKRDVYSFRISGQKEHRRDKLFEHLAGIDSKERRLEKTHSGIQTGISANLTDKWKLRLHAGRYERAPSFFELFGDRGAVAGNINLANEKSRKYDLTLIYQLRNVDYPRLTMLEISGYYNHVKNLIRFIQNSQFVSRPYNIGAAQLNGIETRWNISFSHRLRFKANYVYQHAENRSAFPYENGRNLPNAPTHRFNGNTEFSVNRWRMNYDVNIENRHFLDRANLRGVDGRILHNLRLTIPTESSAIFNIEVCNLTNNQASDIWAYPLPGRSYFFTLYFDKNLSKHPKGEIISEK